MDAQIEHKNKKINFAWPVTSCNREDYDAFCQFMAEHKSMLAQNQIAIWGAGIRGTEFSLFFEKNNYRNFFFADNNPEKWNGTINGFPIISPDELTGKMQQENVKILISTENSKDIEEDLMQKGYVKNQDFFTIQSGLYDKYIAEFQRQYNGNVLFLGDCEFSKISISDQDMDNLGEMLKKHGGEERIKVLAMHGMGIRSFYHVFCTQISEGMKPDKLMIMVNLDTLTGKQHLLPRSQHEELLQQIYHLSNKENREFEKYLQVVHQRSQNYQIEFFTRNPYKKIVSENKARNYFRLNYMYDLDMETEGMIYLGKTLDLAETENIAVTAFIPPVNYIYAEKLLGDNFRRQYVQNVEKIRTFVAEKQCKFLDLSFCMEPELFAMPDTPDETANESGRKKLAHLLLDALQEELSL